MFRQKAHLQAHLPACKRKRDAIEAKYLAEHTSDSTVIKQEYPPPSPVDSEQTGEHIGDVGNNNNEIEYNSETSGGGSRQNYDSRENGLPTGKRDVDLSFNYTKLPPGIPPLIRDPA